MESKNCCKGSCLITPPKGFVPPEGTAQGKPFNLVCTFEPSEDGMLKLTQLGDIRMEESDEDDKGEETMQSKPDYSQYAQGIMGGMGEGGMGQGAPSA